MLIDAHLHTTGQETTAGVLRSLDEAGVDLGVLLAPFLSPGYSIHDAASLRRANAYLAQLVRGHEDRLFGLAVVDPRDPAAADDLRHAVETLGLRGVKMVPTGWFPYEDRVQPVFAVASELKLPVLFHSGIFIDGRSGRFCHPTYFESLRDHPGARVTLAHLAWPWTDEALAVGVIDLINGVPPDRAAFRFDLSFGPPPPYRREVLAKALEVLGPGLLQFASDCFLPCSGAHIAERRGWVVDLLAELGLDDPIALERIWSGTARAWLGLGDEQAERATRRGPATDAGMETGTGTEAGSDPAMGAATSAAMSAATPGRPLGADATAPSRSTASVSTPRHPPVARDLLAETGARGSTLARFGRPHAAGWLGRASPMAVIGSRGCC